MTPTDDLAARLRELADILDRADIMGAPATLRAAAQRIEDLVQERDGEPTQPCPHCVHPQADGKPTHCLICGPALLSASPADAEQECEDCRKEAMALCEEHTPRPRITPSREGSRSR